MNDFLANRTGEPRVVCKISNSFGRMIDKVSQESFTDRKKNLINRIVTPEQRAEIYKKRIEIISTVLLAVATIATAWSGYQSSRWGGEQTAHSSNALRAIVRSGHFANLAEQKMSLQANLFSNYQEALSLGNTNFADFLLNRFPEPLKTATLAWLKTEPLTNPAAPLTPFEMPEYVLPETLEAARWEEQSEKEIAQGQAADEISDRYLLFTIIFASVLFFGGVSGKFGWQPIDLTNLAIGVIVLVGALILLFTMPIVP